MRLTNSVKFKKRDDQDENSVLFHSLLNPVKEILFAHAIIDKKGAFLQLSKEIIQLTGVKKSVLKKSQIGKILSHSSAISVRQLISTVSHASPFVSSEINLIRQGQSSIPMELVMNLYTENGKEQLFCIFRNMNPDRRLIAELFTLKEHYRLLAEHTSYVQILLDKDLKSIYISPSCKLLSGYSSDEAKLMNLFSLVHPDDFETFWEHLNSNSNQTFINFRFRFKDKERQFIPVECQLSRIVDSFGQPEYVVLNLHDITRQKLYELDLIRARKEAETADKMKNNFLASISHELRTPLNSIIGFARILDQNEFVDDAHKYIQCIETSGIQLLSLIDNLLEYAKLENEETEIEIQPVDIKHFFEELAINIKIELNNSGKKNFELIGEWDIATEAKEIKTNPGVLKSIFSNLISNAFKFTTEGYVHYGCKPYGIKSYLFYVEDSGIGIPHESTEIVFDKFTQVDQSLSRRFGGAGLGLSVTKRFVELLGGEIWVLSEPGIGSSFYFTLPISNH
ncbi:MAG: PAS domain S-box protein [Marinilabiliaceae bacterium]|nr:PAS domain S-box protein [Marinilabiliaceae bacterium]